jgi:dTMP kinase
MTTRGILITIEGIDGSGKNTQAKLLEHSLLAQGHSVFFTGYPQYDSWFGQMVGKFLNGELGSLESVDPRFAALLYAGDRYESKSQLERALNEGKIVLSDRYVASNLAHQVARAPAEKRTELLRWIEHLEYSIYGMPRESLILYLRIPAAEAQKLVAKKSARGYTNAKHDLQEGSIRHLEEAAEMYDMLSRSRPWATIQCYDAQRGSIRLPEEISAEMLEAVQTVLNPKDAR